MSTDTKAYLGDGVYADFDGYHIVLSVERNGRIETVYLEPPVYDALVNYRDALVSKMEAP